ncbi:MAG: hypothetical protein AB1806_00390 [Acidobacteriota bacterium]
MAILRLRTTWASIRRLPEDTLRRCEGATRLHNEALLSEIGLELGAVPDWLILNRALLALQSEIREARVLGLE